MIYEIMVDAVACVFFVSRFFFEHINNDIAVNVFMALPVCPNL